jgi:hypothetical protein
VSKHLARTPTRAGVVVFAPLGFALVLTLDTALTVHREGRPAWSALLAFVVVAFALGSVVSTAMVLLRRELHAGLLRATGRRGDGWPGGLPMQLLFVILDVTALALIASYETLRSANDLQRIAATLGLGLLYGLARVGLQRLPRLLPALVLALALGAVLTSGLFSWRAMDRTRLALDLLAIAAFVWAAEAWVPVTRRMLLGAASLCLVCIVAAEPCARAMAVARRLLHHEAPHARSMRWPLLPLFDWDGDGAPRVLGGVDCQPLRADVFPGARERPLDGVDQNCVPGDGVRPAPPAPARPGPATRPDVLLVSIDALRWDALDALPDTVRTLGPHARFERAVAPATRTIDSLPATLRGRPMRMVEFSELDELAIDAPTHDPHPTLGTALSKLGYRAITVPTHRYLDPVSRAAAGFESVVTPTFAQIRDIRPGVGKAKPIVRAGEALAQLERSAREVEQPLLLWVHLMETHAPYHWGEGTFGPEDPTGHRHAVAELDHALARFLETFAALRGRRPVVAIWGDHGEEFLEHGGRHHGSTVHAEQARVVFLLSGPGVPAARIDAPVSTTALPATVLDLLGAAAEPTFVTPSLLPCMSGVSAACPEVAVSELRFRGRFAVGYTTADHRLLVDPVFDIEQLFDSRADPYEQHDLAERADAPLQRARTLARAWDERH